MAVLRHSRKCNHGPDFIPGAGQRPTAGAEIETHGERSHAVAGKSVPTAGPRGARHAVFQRATVSECVRCAEAGAS